LECEKCDTPYHLSCLNPPLSDVPEGEWFCETCAAKPGAPIGVVPKPTQKKKTTAKMKKEVEEYGEGGDDEDAENEVGQKRKGGQRGTAPAKRKK